MVGSLARQAGKTDRIQLSTLASYSSETVFGALHIKDLACSLARLSGAFEDDTAVYVHQANDCNSPQSNITFNLHEEQACTLPEQQGHPVSDP